ncbi:MAG: fructose-bisphosphate aldolase [Candidatus Peribacteraceae bacterium]|nr:fructose-bisphosphate aldolase [Candidatus Peribacteraceae bacterium]MDD5742644.1 fructose-bisphosphate aldolase [Candidatus Peribacteraceae bacterium]
MSERLTFDQTVEALRDPNRPPHFLAMDQSAGTHRKHMQQFGVPIGDEADFQQKAETARVMLATTPGLGKEFGAAIVHNDLYSLVGPDGRPLQEHLEKQGVLVIGKGMGLDSKTGLATEVDTVGDDMQKLVEIGVHLIKTRTTAKCTLPQYVDDAAEQMVEVQKQAAKNGKIAAILEPEFDIKSPGTLAEREELMVQLLGRMMHRIQAEGISKHPFAIKTSFPTAGRPETEYQEPIDPQASAESWKRICERAEIPEELLVVFLSGGHSSATSRALLQEMAKVRAHSGSSFSRANVERPYQMTFPKAGGVDIPAGQDAILLEGLKNRRAMEGRYDPNMEQVKRYADLAGQAS